MCASAQSNCDPALSTASPLGQPRLLLISTVRPEPSIPERSSLAFSPQSVQYIYLGKSKQVLRKQVKSPVLTPRQPLDNTNPISWYKAIARGLSRFCQTKTFLMEPSRLPTSIRFVPVSVQYIFLPIASTASPSVVNRPEKTERCTGHCSFSQLSQELMVFPLCTSSGSCFRLCLPFHWKFKDYSTRVSENLSFSCCMEARGSQVKIFLTCSDDVLKL